MTIKAIAHYSKLYFGLLFTGLITVATLNAIVDPADIYRVVRRDFNRVKPFMDRQGISRVKSLAIAEGDYDTLLLGNSRVFWGLNPEAPAFEPLDVYNGAIKSASFYQVYEIFKYALQRQDIEMVILGLNVNLFDVRRPAILPDQDFPLSGFAGKNVALANWGSLISLQTLAHSGFTVLHNRVRENPIERYTDRGYLNPDYPRVSRTPNFRRLALKMQNGDYPSVLTFGPETMAIFEEFLAECQERQIRVILFIEPSHAVAERWQVRSGNIKTTELWKHKILERVVASGADVTLWDFSGFNSVTTEVVPTNNEQEMQYFLDPIHYTDEAGLLIAERIIKGDRATNVPDDFGVELTPNNIEPHLEAIRAQARVYDVKVKAIDD